jgi:hypothetical protein
VRRLRIGLLRRRLKATISSEKEEGARILRSLVDGAFQSVFAEPEFFSLIQLPLWQSLLKSQDHVLFRLETVTFTPPSDDKLLEPHRRSVAVRWIIELAAAVFVDEMRMLYVAASDLARAANAHRYVEFVGIAQAHFEDFKRQSERFYNDLEPEFINSITTIERRQSGMFDRLKFMPVPEDALRYLPIMRATAELIHALCGPLLSDTAYAQNVELITRLGNDLLTSHAGSWTPSLDMIWRIRLATQTEVLNRARSIRTIADDVDQSFSVTYFIIDRWLLEKCIT